MKQEEEALKENPDEEDSQMDAVIEVKGSTTTVTVSWDKKNEEVDDSENGTNANDQMIDTADADDTSEGAETKMKQDIQESGVKGKRKAISAAETSPAKKTKLINDGFCLFVGNLNNSKKSDEVKESLANYFMKQSLLFQDIRLARSKKHAFIDLASEMDLTKGLTLNGGMIHDKPMKIAKAKVKSEETVKVSAKNKKAAKDEKCLFLKNVPYNATKQDILKIFAKAVNVRFPGGTEGPEKGIAFVEFKSKEAAEKVRKRQEVKIQGRVLIVDHVGAKHVPIVTKKNEDKDNKKDAVLPPNNILFVSKLPFSVKEENIKKAFQKAVSVTVPQSQGKSRGFAFVEFATVAEAEKALQSSKNIKICSKPVRVQFCEAKSESATFLSNSLIVMGLAEKTTVETLQSAFEGASSARVIVNKETGVSKGYGFVDFESEDDCKAAKEAMEDSEIDGSQVTVAFAKAKSEKSPGSPTKTPPAPVAAQPAGEAAGGGKRKGRKRNRKGKGKGPAATPQEAVKEVENKD
ncbi:nucleolin-like isoform X2 [Centropristis striata]|nr:nucleolin-like isoform X2 [Centropristis striata]